MRAGRGAIDVRGATVTGVPAGERRTVTAAVAEPGLTGGTRPEVTLGAGGSLVDAAGNVLPSTTRTAFDGAPPVIVSALTGDGGGRQAASTPSPWTSPSRLPTPPTATARTRSRCPATGSLPPGGASGSSLSLSLAEAPGPDGGVRPAVAYARGAATAVRDASGNEAAGRSFSGSRDGVAPVLVGAAMLDQDLDGMVDAVRYDFSEPVVHSPADCRSACSFSLAGYQLELAGPGVGASVTVAVTEQPDGATVSTAGYTPLGGGVRDGSGNSAPAASLPTADASPPVATSALTVDSDNDGRIDRIDMTFSEPIASAADGQAPFSFDAAGYAVSGVSAASDDQLSVSLVEVAGYDTGSAPQLTYTGQGNRLTDANGTEHARRAYPGLTRDAVAPRFLEARTADVAPATGNGTIDAVDLIYSEEMAGSDDPARFSVSGPRSVTGVAYVGDRVRVNFAEGSGYDTDARPTVSYDGSGDVRDTPLGDGDTAQPAPAAAGQALDAAGPVIVTAATGEENEVDPQPDGKLDSVRVGFSEAIDPSPSAGTAIALSDGLVVAGAAAGVSGDELVLEVQEGAEPVGDLQPSVTVTAPAEILDEAVPPNPARAGAFGGTADGVRPALVSAQDGERTVAGDCAPGVIDGVVDCFRAAWSEDVDQPNTHAVFSGSSRAPLEVMSTTPADRTDIRVATAALPDRDDAGSITYLGGGGVVDGSTNPAIPGGPLDSEAACLDRGDEDNDVRADSVSMNAPGFRIEQHLCAADRDWYRVDAQGAGEVHVRIDPFETLSITARLEDAGGSTVDGPVTSSEPGEPVTLYLDGLTPGDPYWVEVSAGGLQEGPYCADPTPSPGENCDDGDDTEQ